MSKADDYLKEGFDEITAGEKIYTLCITKQELAFSPVATILTKQLL
jgi:hypothetical protein